MIKMLDYLKELLDDLNFDENIKIDNRKQKYFALDTAIEILEKLKNKKEVKKDDKRN